MSVYTPPQNNYSNLALGTSTSANSITLTTAGSSYASGQVLTVASGTGTTWATTAKTTAQGQLHLEGDDADLVINGVKLSDTLKSINDRLSILQPKPELHSKYDNLRQAYEHYKTLEALLYEETSKE